MKLLLLIFIISIELSAQLNETILTLTKNNASNDFLLDGFLNDAFWNTAIKFENFKQVLPQAGISASEKTEVYLTYDDENIYVGFKSYSQNNNEIYSSVLERDKGLNVDDFVEVLIDSRNDKSNQLSFQTNLLGTRTDTEITDNGGVFNTSWNTYWDAASAITDFGWSAEFKIPLSSLRFEMSEKNIMGFKFRRYIKSKNETVAFPLSAIDIDKISYNQINSQIVEFNNLIAKNPLYFTPYVISNVSQSYKLNSRGTEYFKNTEYLNGKNYLNSSGLDKLISSVGLDVKYKLDNSNTLDLTLNTDFAQAEADDRIINLTRYSISLPEKRSFFLENADLFKSVQFDHNFFHSRRIGIENGINVPIIGGVRLAGAAGNFEYGLLNMQSHSVESADIDAQNFTVVRAKNKFGSNESYIGGIFTNKSSTENADFSRLAAIDGFFRFPHSITSTFFAASSFERGQNEFRNNAYGFRISRFTFVGVEFDARFREYQQFFNPGMGFLSRPNTKNITLRGGYRFATPGSSWLSRLTIGSWNTFFWTSSSGEKEFKQHNSYITFQFKDASALTIYLPYYQEDRLFTNWKFSENITIPSDKYKMIAYDLLFESGYGGNYNWSLHTIIGDFYGGKQFVLSPGLNYIFNKNFNIELFLDYNRLSLPQKFSANGNGIETQVLYSAKFNYFFSSALSLKAFLQYDNLSETVGTNLRFRYNPDESTNLYIVFNQNINTERDKFNPEKPFVDNQTLIIKYSQTFIF